MYESASDRKKLLTLSKSKAYRDAYLSNHVRASIAYQIQALREKMNLSQQAFALKVGVKQSAVSRLENPDYGKVTVGTLLQIALALDVAVLIKFCAYTEFLNGNSDVSTNALLAETVHESARRAQDLYHQSRRYQPLPFSSSSSHNHILPPINANETRYAQTTENYHTAMSVPPVLAEMWNNE